MKGIDGYMTITLDIEKWKIAQQAASAKTHAIIINMGQKQRFLIGSHVKFRLKKSLASVGRVDLAERTLLTPSVHSIHAARLAYRLTAQWEKIREKNIRAWLSIPADLRHGTEPVSDSTLADNHLRFMTLIDSVTVVDSHHALQAATRMKVELTSVIEKTTGIWFLGAIEVEVISLDMMRRLSDTKSLTGSETRKLDVCETLVKDLDGTLYSNDSSLILVHIHGLVTAKFDSSFERLRKNLLQNQRWSIAPRQIEIKKLSTEYFGKAKSTIQNLKHIARYITKGGNDWYANKAYLRYKIGFGNDDSEFMTEEKWIAKNWRNDQLLRKEHKEEGITDMLSMTVHEIAQLAICIDSLMALSPLRNGYLVRAGK
jgi:hypothetical protein